MMRIGLVSTLATPVRPTGAGSVEGLACLLARELVALGHEVAVFAAAGSEVPGCDVVTVPGTYAKAGMPLDFQQCEVLNLVRAVERSADFDVLHSHAYLLGRLVEPLSHAPMVHTLHTQPYEGETRLVGLKPQLWLTAPSAYQWADHPAIDPVIVPHGVDAAAFTFRPAPEARLCYLGRFVPGKGPLDAIAIAREAGLPLVMAGPETPYFTDMVRPHVDGKNVAYVGSVSDRSRDELLGGSAAMLYPVRHGEPFGLVLAEAMTCGTPVVATDVGAVPEVVQDGVTGRVAPLPELAAAVGDAMALDRGRVRAVALERFSAPRMAQQYEDIYRRAVTGAAVSSRWAVST